MSFLKGEQHAALTLDVLVGVFSVRLRCRKKNASPAADEPGAWPGFVLCLHRGSGESEGAACSGRAYASQACYCEEVRPQLLKMDSATPVCLWGGDGRARAKEIRLMCMEAPGALVRKDSSQADWGGPRVCVSAALLPLAGTAL